MEELNETEPIIFKEEKKSNKTILSDIKNEIESTDLNDENLKNKYIKPFERKKQNSNTQKTNPGEKMIIKKLYEESNEEKNELYSIKKNENSIEEIYIDKEYTIKRNNTNQLFIEFSYKEDQNKTSKSTMEDEGKSIINFNENPKNTLFLLFDGHNGDSVSKYCRNHFDRIFKKNLSDEKLSIKRAITKTFLELDTELKNKGFIHIGSTGTIIYLTEEKNKKIIYSGNVGDTRSTLFNKKIERLTNDHRVNDLREKDRIINNGGFIMNERVNGQLMLTRVFGDFEFKNFGVKCDPFIMRKVIDDNLQNQFLIIASDGIWDMFEEKDIKDIIEELMEKNKDNKDKCITRVICDYLIEESLKAGGWDNISIFAIKMT